MIQAFKDYAFREALDSEPGFSPKIAKWAIHCNLEGRYLGVLPLGDVEAKKVTGKPFLKCPDLSLPEMKTGGSGTRHFLIDAASVVALFGKEAGSEKARVKHAFFVRILTEAAVEVSSLGPAAACLGDPLQVETLRRDLEHQKAAETDNVTFLIEDEYPLEGDDWHDWWRTFRLRFSKPADMSSDGKSMRCFLTGDLVKPVATHEKIRGLSSTGGLPMGDVLVGFKQESFCSFGLEQSANAAMSASAAKAYQAGLNDVIAKGQNLAGTRVAHWFRNRIAVEDDPYYLMLDPKEADLDARDRAKGLLESIRLGVRKDLAENSWYAVTLSGAAGRVMVRDWMEGSFEQLLANVAAWFNDLSIVHPEGHGLARSPKFMAVLGSTVRDLDDLASPLVSQMWRVALRNEAIPSAAHAQALGRFRISVITGDTPRVAGVALLKAFHIRTARKRQDQENNMLDVVRPALNPDHPSTAYQCGRLMAVLARLQETALPGVKSGIVQRSYAAMSTTPALMIGRLIRTAQFHKDKLASDRPGLAAWYDRQLSEITTHIRDQPPSALTLEEQSLFAIGYYQQLAHRTEKKDEGVTNDQESL